MKMFEGEIVKIDVHEKCAAWFFKNLNVFMNRIFVSLAVSFHTYFDSISSSLEAHEMLLTSLVRIQEKRRGISELITEMRLIAIIINK